MAGRNSILSTMDTVCRSRLSRLNKFGLRLIHQFTEKRALVERKIRKTLAWQWWQYLKRFGALNGCMLFYSLYLKPRTDNVFAVFVPQVRTPIYLRSHTSDIPTFSQIFASNEYDMTPNIQPKLIIDGGANVGYTTVYFANRFPEARIIAVEPEASNLEMLRQNTLLYPNVTIIEAAVWNKHTKLAIENPEDDKWAFRVMEGETGERAVRALTVEDIMQLTGHRTIDILKLDIEGAEKEVFSDCGKWLGDVRVLMIELHDHLKPGCSSAVYSAVSKYNFSQSRNGTTDILVRNQSA
jgi:FkbM family methyltransferase